MNLLRFNITLNWAAVNPETLYIQEHSQGSMPMDKPDRASILAFFSDRSKLRQRIRIGASTDETGVKSAPSKSVRAYLIGLGFADNEIVNSDEFIVEIIPRVASR